MIKKILLGFALLTSTVGIATAGAAPYVGAGIGVNANTANNGWFGSNRGMPFNILAGYGGLISDSFYLAGELSGTLATAVLNNNGALKSTYSYGASVLPGVMLSDHTLGFARAGVVATHFPDVHGGKTLTGGQFGVGLQTGLTQNVDLRAEYDFTAYRSTTAWRFNNVKITSAPRQDAFNLSLIYKFE